MSQPNEGGTSAASRTVLDDASPELTRNYSDAFLNAASKANQADEALDELDGVLDDILGRFPAFAGLLAGGGSSPRKDALLVRTLEGRALPVVVQFLRVLNRHGRLDLLGPIARAARAEWDRRQNRRPVTVRSAVPLDDGQRDALAGRLGALLNATPVLHVEVDPALIGGLVVQAGDDVYDVSVRNRLEQLRHRLIEGKTHEIQSRRDHFSHSE